MLTRRVVIIAATATAVILVVASTYYTVLMSGPSTTVTIVATGGDGSVAFEPPYFTVQAGQRTNLVIVNHGSVRHELVIPDLGVNALVNAGVTRMVSFTPEKVGTFGFGEPCPPLVYFPGLIWTCGILGNVTVTSA